MQMLEARINKIFRMESWTKSKLFFIWFVGTMLCMLLTTIIAVLILELLYEGGAEDSWRPFNHFMAYIRMLPFGWVLYLLSPLGWASIAALVASISKRRIAMLGVSAATALVAGIFWPALLESIVSI